MKQTMLTVWPSPTECGCVVERRTTLTDTNGSGVLDNIEEDQVPVRAISQCAGHSIFASVEALFEELQHYHGQAWRPDTQGCRCSLAYYIDDREPLDGDGEPVLHPVESARYTKRCNAHIGHADCRDLHDSVLAENRAKNKAVIRVAKALDMQPDEVPYKMNAKRQVVIDHVKLGVTKKVVDDALAEG